jgi:hypothetical protein
MPITRIAERLARLVRERAHYRCEYCQTSEWLSGQPCQIDHIIPRTHGGATDASNLCLACAPCNGFKLDHLDAPDPESGETVALFNPRAQRWHDHFSWSDDGTHAIGLTPQGRATVAALKLNRPLALAARAIWVSIHRHPPAFEEI